MTKSASLKASLTQCENAPKLLLACSHIDRPSTFLHHRAVSLTVLRAFVLLSLLGPLGPAHGLELRLSRNHQLLLEHSSDSQAPRLVGRLLSSEGEPLIGELLVLRHPSGLERSAYSDREGRFQFSLNAELSPTQSTLTVLGDTQTLTELLSPAHMAVSLHARVQPQPEKPSEPLLRICARPLEGTLKRPLQLSLSTPSQSQTHTLNAEDCFNHSASEGQALTITVLPPHQGRTTVRAPAQTLELSSQIQTQTGQLTLSVFTDGPAHLRQQPLAAMAQVSSAGELLFEWPLTLRVGEVSQTPIPPAALGTEVRSLQVRFEGEQIQTTVLSPSLSPALVLPASQEAPATKLWLLLALLPLVGLALWFERRSRSPIAPSEPVSTLDLSPPPMPQSPPAALWIEAYDLETQAPVPCTLFGHPSRLTYQHALPTPPEDRYDVLAPGYLPQRVSIPPDAEGAIRVWLRSERLELRERYSHALELLHIPWQWGIDTPQEITQRFPQTPHLHQHLEALATLTERAYFGPDLPLDALAQSEHHLNQLKKALA